MYPGQVNETGGFHRVCPKGSEGEVSGVFGALEQVGSRVGGCMAEGTGGPFVWFEPGPVRQQVLTVAGPKLAEGPPSTSG